MPKPKNPEQLPGYYLFEKKSSLEYSGLSKVGATTGTVHFATYSPRKNTEVPGLGICSETFYSIPLHPHIKIGPDNWIITPPPGTEVAVKIAHHSERAENDLARECVALATGNTLFHNHDPHRPIQIYGFGQDGGISYIITEVVSDQFADLNTLPKTIPANEALYFVSKMGQIIARFHRLGIVHNDLGTPGNFFIDRKNERTRLIDFGNARYAPLDQHPPFSYDQRSLAAWLLRKTTGKLVSDLEKHIAAQKQSVEFWQKVPSRIIAIVERTLGINAERYPNSPSGTEELVSDMLKASNSLIPNYLLRSTTSLSQHGASVNL